MDISSAVAARISELCKKHSINMYRLSKESSVPNTTLHAIMIGKSRNPGVETIRKLCSAFGISLSEFFDSPLFGKDD